MNSCHLQQVEVASLPFHRNVTLTQPLLCCILNRTLVCSTCVICSPFTSSAKGKDNMTAKLFCSAYYRNVGWKHLSSLGLVTPLS